jgi:hypothetical protein
VGRHESSFGMMCGGTTSGTLQTVGENGLGRAHSHRFQRPLRPVPFPLYNGGGEGPSEDTGRQPKGESLTLSRRLLPLPH